MVTTAALASSSGTVTSQARRRHSRRGDPQMIQHRGAASSTPSVSPAHQANQKRSCATSSKAFRAYRVGTEMVALVRQMTGVSRK